MFKKVFKGGSKKSKDGPKESDRRKVMVVSADHGLVGKRVLPGLASRKLLDVYAGVTDPNRFPDMDDVTVMKADMDDKNSLFKAFKSKKFDRVVIVTPGNRADWAENALEAADQCKATKFVVLISLVMAPVRETFFGDNYDDMEKAAKQYFPFGYCILRLPLLMDAMIPLCAPSIRTSQSFKDPRDPEKPFRCIALQDVATAVTHIITKPSQHMEKIYHLVGPSVTVAKQADAITKAIGTKVTHEPEDYEQYRETLEDAHVPEWSITGTLEIYKCIDEGNKWTNTKKAGDYEEITGEKPTSLLKWCQANEGHFEPEEEEDDVE
ncbi:Inherit from COG: epimerase dehydratase [Seminavis robusta]|uniref:Inherit from COG: epimerase dehydratase n=1 Tax=Seminavis robusta TaxID=568900 RepID=A0A9N8F1W3_9STRA|nr:Inherit from COG: epimerase dehydratase [Seminavis robusta]|eukprot:Sro2601_g332350.1 Inherit from COG: epimerase dehydratase (323) ;mRNA; f:8531-9499